MDKIISCDRDSTRLRTPKTTWDKIFFGKLGENTTIPLTAKWVEGHMYGGSCAVIMRARKICYNNNIARSSNFIKNSISPFAFSRVLFFDTMLYKTTDAKEATEPETKPRRNMFVYEQMNECMCSKYSMRTKVGFPHVYIFKNFPSSSDNNMTNTECNAMAYWL